MTQSSVDTSGCSRALPSHDDLVAMVMECCPNHAPLPGESHLMQMESGRRLMFEPVKAMEVIAERWYGDGSASQSAKRSLLKLPWAESWVKTHAPVPKAAKPGSGRIVNKNAKITMLSTIYPGDKGPHARDEIPVEMDTGVWVFRPVQWLDDVANNWLKDKSAVSLDENQKARLESLPWFRTWLQRLSDKRKRKRTRMEMHQEALKSSEQVESAPDFGPSAVQCLFEDSDGD